MSVKYIHQDKCNGSTCAVGFYGEGMSSNLTMIYIFIFYKKNQGHMVGFPVVDCKK